MAAQRATEAGDGSRRHLARDLVLAVLGISAGVGLTFVPRLFDGDDASGELVSTGQEAVSVAAQPDGAETTGSATAPAGPAPGPGAESAASAVERFLDAERQGDTAASYELLSAEDRRSLPTAEEWAAVHAGLLARIVRFELGEPEASGEGVVVPATVEFEPGLDEFGGLRPGRSMARWATVQDDRGWRVFLEGSSFEPLFPPESEAARAAERWLADDGACDPKAAAGPGVTFLGLRRYLVEQLCAASGVSVAGPAAELEDPTASADLVAAFGPEALGWARVVPLDGSVPARLVLAPIGDRWAVVDVVDAR